MFCAGTGRPSADPSGMRKLTQSSSALSTMGLLATAQQSALLTLMDSLAQVCLLAYLAVGPKPESSILNRLRETVERPDPSHNPMAPAIDLTKSEDGAPPLEEDFAFSSSSEDHSSLSSPSSELSPL